MAVEKPMKVQELDKLLAHMAGLASPSRHDGYKQAKREMLLVVNELEYGES